MQKWNKDEYRIYTTKSEADKAISSLKGILLGILIDKEVNDKEITELRYWSQKHYHLINRNPFREFMLIISENTHNKQFDSELVEDMYWLCQKYETDNYFYDGVTSDLQILQGICHGIIADGVINDKEILGLENWLAENEHLKTFYPYDEISSLITSVLSDGVIDDIERKRLLAYFNEFVALSNIDISNNISEKIKNVTIDGICSSDPQVIFKDKIFCLSGNFKSDTKDNIHAKILSLGGDVRNNISKKVDYLIIGANSNPSWAFSCYGRKVEKAEMLRKNGSTISIIHEFDFNDFIEEA